ncbi:hypothetical protein HX773_24925, partial [Pantoea sp. B9002]|uniref:Ig-like domain-containing protein n=1 Tax=Pantoea sp. B9002 TaxID=2726979 RepID=UPI0015A1204D
GSAEPGSVVTVFNGAAAVGSVTAGADGSWSWQYSSTERFAEGAHALTVRATDPAGNVSVMSETFTITVDTLIAQPLLDTVTDAVAGGVIGDIANNGHTNDPRPRLNGSADPGTLVIIFSDAMAVGSVMANANTGVWSWQYANDEKFADGKYVLTVQAVDKAGNTSVRSEAFTINIDTTPPPAVAGMQWDGETLNIHFDGLEYKVGDQIILSIDGDEHNHTLTDEDLNSGTISLTWSSATKGNSEAFIVKVIDVAGNISDSRTLEKNDTILRREDFETQSTQTFINNQTIKFSGFDVNVINAAGGGFFNGITGWQFPSPTMALTFMGGTKIELSLQNQDSDYISFTAGDFNNTEQFIVIFFDSLGREVDRQILTPVGGLMQEIRASVPFGMTFSKVTLELNTSGVWIDNIVMGKTEYNISEGENPDTKSSSFDAFTLKNESYSTLDSILEDITEISYDENRELTEANKPLVVSIEEVLTFNTSEFFLDSEMKPTAIIGDNVTLSETPPDDIYIEEWIQMENVTMEGINYQGLQPSKLDAELLVHQDIIVNINSH